MSNNLELYNDIVEKIENLPSVDSALSKIGDATLAHFLTRELNLLRDPQELADRATNLGDYAVLEQALGIAAVQVLQDVIQNRNPDSSTALQEALRQLARNRLNDIASSRATTGWLIRR